MTLPSTKCQYLNWIFKRIFFIFLLTPNVILLKKNFTDSSTFTHKILTYNSIPSTSPLSEFSTLPQRTKFSIPLDTLANISFKKKYKTKNICKEKVKMCILCTHNERNKNHISHVVHSCYIIL